MKTNKMNISENHRKVIELACECIGTTQLAERMQKKGIEINQQIINRFKYGQRVVETELSNTLVRFCISELRKLSGRIDVIVNGRKV